MGAQPFVTAEIDVEGYFCSDEYLMQTLDGSSGIDMQLVKSQVAEGEAEKTIAQYVNGRLDQERKQGTIGKLNIGKLSSAASTQVASDPLKYMKGKRKLSKYRAVLHTQHALRLDIDRNLTIPIDDKLSKQSKKYFS